jgi:hypothetical protein
MSRHPNFIILGAAKAGTTALYEYLKQHPQVYMTPLKETNYYALRGKNLDFRGPGDAEFVNRLSITDEAAYRAQFDGSPAARRSAGRQADRRVAQPN